MQQFIAKFGEQIEGVLSGFDRLVFRGTLRSLNIRLPQAGKPPIAIGMEQYLWNNGILFKDYGRHLKKVSEQVRQASLQAFQQAGLPVIYLPSSKDDKEQLARRLAAERNITRGPVCALSVLEPSPSFDHRGTHMVARVRPCQVLYHYQIHPKVGWMYGRIQTWFPFNVQIGLNGREWLARQLDRAGIRYQKAGNCLLQVADYQRAQELFQEQLHTHWPQLLDAIAGTLNPLHEEIFHQYPASYYWTCYQSEWATDVVFRDGQYLKRLMERLTRQAMLVYGCTDVMRFFDKKITKAGKIPNGFGGQLETDLKQREEGVRVKFHLNWNSVKFYDKAYTPLGNVLRAAETTINQAKDFRAYRPKEGGPETDLQWRPLRAGIADLNRRAEVSQKANERLINALAAVDESRTVQELTARIQKPVMWAERRVRALRPWGDDHPLLAAINHGEFFINGFRNRDLQTLLYSTPPASPQDTRRRSAAVSRKLRMLRAHGLIQKVPKTHRYQITPAGRGILIAVLTSANTSVNRLDRLSAAA
jgi:hypothetical protein